MILDIIIVSGIITLVGVPLFYVMRDELNA